MERNYDVKFRLTDMKTSQKTEMSIRACFYNSGAFDYGNGMGLCLEYKNGIREYFDIRYDTDYSEDSEADYLKKLIRDKWSGKNGSWKASYITVKHCFKL